MKIVVIGLSMVLSILCNNCFAQNQCPPIHLYRTSYIVHVDSTRMFVPLNFIISEDSIIGSRDEQGKKALLAFRILNKECLWNADFSEGKSKYRLLLYDVKGNKTPTLIISQEKNKPFSIEILYENGEKRLFM